MEGRSLKDLFAGRDYDPEKMYQQMKVRMDQEGLPYGKRTHTYNSRLAQELGAWADTQQVDGEKLHDLLYRAYFVDSKNIGDINVLIDLVAEAGLDVGDAKKALEARSFKEVVDADWNKSKQYGVTGVPTFVASGYGVVGAQPYETLEALLDKVGAVRR